MTTIGLAGAFLGGVLTLLSPCSAVLLPSFFAYAFGGRSTVIARTGVFYLGLATTLIPLGVAASTIGAFFNSHRDGLVLSLSIMVFAFGLLQVTGLSFGLLRQRATGGTSGGTGVVQIFMLGTVYGVAGVCSGPILGSVLAVAGVGGSPTYGGLLLAVYALGMCVPLAVLAVFWERLDVNGRRWLVPRPINVGPIQTSSTAVISGTILIAVGVLLLASGGTANLGGIVGAGDQFSIEQWAGRVGDRIPDTVVLIIAVTVVISGLLARQWWIQSRPATSNLDHPAQNHANERQQ
jgi:cytochrome c biogenesis protein CcdA